MFEWVGRVLLFAGLLECGMAGSGERESWDCLQRI